MQAFELHDSTSGMHSKGGTEASHSHTNIHTTHKENVYYGNNTIKQFTCTSTVDTA